MSLKQFNVAYFVNEDRILFRFNTVDHAEYKLWLTRRITHFILLSIDKFIENEFTQQPHSVEKVISESQQSGAEGVNFAQGFEAGLKYPLGVDAVLVMDVKCKMTNNGEQDIFSLDLILPGGGNINLTLPMPVMKSLIMMLEEQNIQAKWGSAKSAFLN